MTNPFDSMKTEEMTVYGVTGSDLYGVKTYGVLGVVPCEYKQGGSMQTDSDGNQFVPSSTFYPSSALNFEIKRGDQIAVGNTIATSNPDDTETETVRKIEVISNPFGWGNETIVYTG